MWGAVGAGRSCVRAGDRGYGGKDVGQDAQGESWDL